MQKRLAVLASGEGTLLRAMVMNRISIGLVVCDRYCPALEKAQSYGLRSLLLPRNDGKLGWRRVFSANLASALLDHEIQIAALAGYKTILESDYFSAGIVTVNTHPSLLPLYRGPGQWAVEQALENHDQYSGMTIHYVTKEVDAGQIIAQRKVKIYPGDTVATLWQRIKAVECQVYPAVLREFANPS
jgi:phosphoribosylglycinamide formyltransferase 1